MAAVNAVVAVVFGTMAGIALARRSGKWSRPFLILVFLILVTPEIVDAISYLIFFVRINLGWSFARLVIGHSIFNSAVVTLIVLARLQGSTSRWRRRPPTSAPLRGGPSARSPCR